MKIFLSVSAIVKDFVGDQFHTDSKTNSFKQPFPVTGYDVVIIRKPTQSNNKERKGRSFPFLKRTTKHFLNARTKLIEMCRHWRDN